MQSCGTSKTGYSQRKLEKTHEDVIAQYDGTVRNSQNRIVVLRFLDGMSPTYLEKFTAKHLLVPSSDPAVETLRSPIAQVRRMQTQPPDVVLLVPFNMERYLDRFICRGGPRSAHLVGPASSVDDVAVRCWVNIPFIDEAIRAAVASATNTSATNTSATKTAATKTAATKTAAAEHFVHKNEAGLVSIQAADTAVAAVLAHFPSACLDAQQYVCAVVTRSHHRFLSAHIFAQTMMELLSRLQRCAIVGGEPLGSSAAASISQPATQTCLNTFHSTGAEIKTGTIRLQEVIEQSPSADCRVVVEARQAAVATNRFLMERIALSLLPVRTRDVVSHVVLDSALPMQRFDALWRDDSDDGDDGGGKRDDVKDGDGQRIGVKDGDGQRIGVKGVGRNEEEEEEEEEDEGKGKGGQKEQDGGQCNGQIMHPPAAKRSRRSRENQRVGTTGSDPSSSSGASVDVSLASASANEDASWESASAPRKRAKSSRTNRASRNTRGVGGAKNGQAGPQFAIMYLDADQLRAHQITTVEILKRVSAHMRIRCSATSQRSAEPFIALHFGCGCTRQGIEASVHGCLNLLLRGFAQVLCAQVKPRFPSEFECAESNAESAQPVKPVFELHCTCKDLTPFFMCDESMFNLQTLRVSNVRVACDTYGIEGALSTLFNEIKKAVTDNGSMHVNNHHIYLLACSICHSGRMLATTRHGMNKGATSVMQRASFEMPKFVFVQATTYGEKCADISKCLSTSTITGGVCGVGTGVVRLYDDPDAPPGTTSASANAASFSTSSSSTASPTASSNRSAAASDPAFASSLPTPLLSARLDQMAPNKCTPNATGSNPCDSWQWWDHAKNPAVYMQLLHTHAVQLLESTMRRNKKLALDKQKQRRNKKLAIDKRERQGLVIDATHGAGNGDTAALYPLTDVGLEYESDHFVTLDFEFGDEFGDEFDLKTVP